MNNHKNSAFTLVELSIVLVIVALIIGGVVLGRHMITVSQINAQVSQIQKFDVAINTFKLKYNSLPADSSTVKYKTHSAAADSFGNGNSIFDGGSSSTNWPATDALYFFAALSHSRLTQENYTFFGGSWGNNQIGNLYPEIAISKGNGMVAIGGVNGGLYYFLGITVGNQMPFLHNISANGTINPALAYVLDQKMDDGYPSEGKIFASNNRQTTSSTCTTCSGYTGSTVIQFAPLDNTCLNADDTYNADATDVVANRCRLVIQSGAVGGN